MESTRSSVPPAPKDKGPGPAKAKPKITKREGNSFCPRLPLLEGSFHDADPLAREKGRAWRMDDSNCPTFPEDFEGACDCLGDNNARLTKEEIRKLESPQDP